MRSQSASLLVLLLFPAAASAQNPCAPTEPLREYIYAGGRLLASVGQVAPATLSFSVDSSPVPEPAGSVSISVRLVTPDGNPTSCPVSVRYSTSPGTAAAGSDFIVTADTLTFPDGFASGEAREILVPILNDDLDEAVETFAVTLSNPLGGAMGSPVTHTVTILDEDPPPSMSVADVSVAEGDSGNVTASFVVSLSGPSGLPFTSTYETLEGTAAAGSDYTPASGTLVIPPGQTETALPIAVRGDLLYEPNETLYVRLAPTVRPAPPPIQAQATILNDDLPELTVSSPTVTETSGSAVLTVTLTPPIGEVVTVGYGTLDGSATAGSDYAATSGTLTFDPGVSVQSITVPILDDSVFEEQELFQVQLTPSANAAFRRRMPRVTIEDDDPSPLGPPRADFDGDGQEDIVWRHELSGANRVWLMDGTNSTDIMLPSVADPDWQIVGTGDFNRDGAPDILWRNRASGENRVWLMTGTELTDSAVLTPEPDPSWEIAGAADFDHDLAPEILWHNRSSGENRVWFMDGTATTNSVSLPTLPGASSEIVGAADFDHDGNTDIVWQQRRSGVASVWYMDGLTVSREAALPPVPAADWRIGGVADFDRDGHADLLLRNAAGANLIWYMEDVTRTGTAELSPVSDAEWKVVAPK